MTVKSVEDLFLAYDLRTVGEVTLSEAVRRAATHEDVVVLMDGVLDRLRARVSMSLFMTDLELRMLDLRLQRFLRHLAIAAGKDGIACHVGLGEEIVHRGINGHVHYEPVKRAV
jgi:hypothetical protein